MPLEPTDEMQSETAEMQQGKIQLTPAGWQLLEARITELRDAKVVYAEIAVRMGIVENTLRKLRLEKDAYQTNLTDLEGMFQIFNEDNEPDEPEFAPEQNIHYKHVLKQPTPTRAPKFSLPYQPRCFQGREQDLRTLRDGFLGGEHRQAIVALGGMGKTYLALEYARRFWKEYKPVFWAQADTEASLDNRYAEWARSLGLMRNPTRARKQAVPLSEEEARIQKQAEQAQAIAAFRQWLDTHDGWLLVLDNADAPEFLHNYLPADPQGHVLLTTRAHDLSDLHFYNPLELEKLSPPASLQFFLQRCNRHNAPPDEQQAAADLAADLDYLPLALAHAAAYITRRRTGFAHYRTLYQKQKLALMDSANTDADAPGLLSIRATWELNFQALEHDTDAGRAGAYARDLLCFSAFLGADSISCELALGGAKAYCPPLDALLPQPGDDGAQPTLCDAKREAIFHDLLLPLIRYSLVTKNLESPPRFSIHRMVQLAIADRLGSQKRDWQEKALRAVDGAFPVPDAANWQACERLLPHAIAVADMARQEGLRTLETGRLLCDVGEFVMIQGRYGHAALYARYALDVRETLAAEHPQDRESLLALAVSLHYLGNICHHQHKLEEAEDLLKRALAIRQRHSGEADEETLNVGNDLAAVYNSLSQFSQAEATFLQLLARAEAVYAARPNANAPYHKAVLRHNLALSCYRLERYPEAERRYREALDHWAAYAVENHPQHAGSWHELAKTYRKMERLEAEQCYHKALEIQQAAYPKGHEHTAVTLYNIADLYKDANQYNQAEVYYKQAATEDIRVFGKIHPAVAEDYTALANLYDLMRRQAEANQWRRWAEEIMATFAKNQAPTV